ncbi:hypothetical protein SLEP1_g15075 [Rubroshorea leprosula]|uniref:Endonuclease/exonuclease/phosphatase n=1 Tax=Rubroshorea leprosula TaxID=152421 RepID=A0AAV5IL80_9ROSI|nr:hypothetical protein SLEP1_g15075 [Rubroshorea leprosula]
MLDHVKWDYELGLDMEKQGVAKHLYSEKLRASPKYMHDLMNLVGSDGLGMPPAIQWRLEFDAGVKPVGRHESFLLALSGLGNPRVVHCLIELVGLKKLNIVGQESLSWLVCGDFNDLLSQGEKIGGNLQPYWMIQGFNETIAACGLTEVQMVGGNFTRKRGKVLEKLDRGLASTPWKCLFPQGRVRLLPPLSLDHTPLWLTIDGRQEKQNRHRKKFQFEEMWLRDVGCQEVLPEVISLEQSAFLSNILIIDNVLIAYEVLHLMHARKRRKKG